MADVEAMIKEKLEGVTVNLDTKEDIQAIDKAMEGLASTDVAKITAVEQFLSPAKVDLVNLMLKELVEGWPDRDGHSGKQGSSPGSSG